VETRELCAIKFSVCLDRASACEQLASELDRCTRAASEGAVGLLGWNLEAEQPFLVFELAHAGTLGDELEDVRGRGRVYHPARALERIREVLVAIKHVHARGLIHRDVKPANLLRFDSGIKLTDFGTGRSIERPPEHHTQAFVGTRMYAAPEQRSGRGVDERADLYAVGCILHEMLTGRVPEPHEAPLPAERYPTPLVLPALHELLHSLLAAEKELRPASAEAALEGVDEALGAYATARRAWTGSNLGPCPY
jgi:serine/threonine protein kinase